MYKTVLVNKENPIKESFLKRIELVEIKNTARESILIEKNTYAAYLKLASFLENKGITIGIDSAYRSVEHQQQIYTNFVTQYGKEYADKVVAPVSKSEHHTGLAIDLDIKVNGSWVQENSELMELEEIYELPKYLYKFGFILRYPKEKENITGYPYEPWHIRYVGEVVAKIIYDNNWTLEEYMENFSGVIAINKKQGMTSFDVVNDISHLFGIKKVGHTGTLDPLAEGVLMVAIGKATKIVELLTAEDKEYIAEAKLGIKTDTYDITGEVIAKKEIPKNLKLKETLESYKKTYMQEVPIYSAIKVAGKKLYEYARNKKEVVLPKKEVTIKEIELLEKTANTFKFRTLVSKGTYIRSLINDIGNSLNTYATMTELIRTKQGKIKLEDTYSIDDIKNNNYKISKIEDVLNYPIVSVNKELEFKISNGQKISNDWNITTRVIFKNKSNELLGIYEVEGNLLKTWKNFC